MKKLWGQRKMTFGEFGDFFFFLEFGVGESIVIGVIGYGLYILPISNLPIIWGLYTPLMTLYPISSLVTLNWKFTPFFRTDEKIDPFGSICSSRRKTVRRHAWMIVDDNLAHLCLSLLLICWLKTTRFRIRISTTSHS